MRLATLLLIGLLPLAIEAQSTMSNREIRRIESTLATWLAHPMEFGEKPKRTKYLATIDAVIAGEPKPIPVHVVEFEMPDGTYGKGFVNPITWAFGSDLSYDKISNEQLVMVYSGWVWLFSALQNGRALTEFTPTTEAQFLGILGGAGLHDVSITSKYRVADSEFFEFNATRGGRAVKGAGSVESNLVLDAEDPLASLPVVYPYLAKVMRGEL